MEGIKTIKVINGEGFDMYFHQKDVNKDCDMYHFHYLEEEIEYIDENTFIHYIVGYRNNKKSFKFNKNCPHIITYYV